MKDKDKILDEIFNNDPFGLLEVKHKPSGTKTADERLLNSFQEITDFIDKNNRAPEPNVSNIAEYQLYTRLKSLREDEEKKVLLEPEDKYQILNVTPKEINSIDDIFNDDILGIFDDEAEELFQFNHTPRELQRAESDFVARRKPCKDFKNYEHLFTAVQSDLAQGKRKLVDFKQGNLRVGTYYVHNGILFYLESINITQKEHYKEDGTRVREDGRTRCIFENGTESNMLKRSVEKILYANGKVVTENFYDVTQEFFDKFNTVQEGDAETGFIYVLSSLSPDPQISKLENLYKIGFSKVDVMERIKNAEKEPTYLMAPVKLIASYGCLNMNPQKLEKLLHNFFGNSCLNIEITDPNGKRHIPREWFIAPLDVINDAINLITSSKIIEYKYDSDNQMIVKR